MKKLFTMIFVIMLVLPAFAQHSLTSRHSIRGNHLNSTLVNPKQFNIQQHFQNKNSFAIMQKLDNEVSQEYDITNSQWVNSYLDEFTYNASGYNTADHYSTWNPDTELYDPEGKQELTYNGGIHPAEQVYYAWDAFTRAWYPIQKRTFSYDGAGNMVLAYTYYFDDPDWILIGKDERTYNGSGSLTLQVLSSWDDSGSEWINGSKTENTYNGSGLLTVSTSLVWDYFTEEWVNDYKDEYTYNGNGQQITGVYYSWDEDSSLWINDYKEDFTYDEHLNMVLILEQEWNGAQWVNSYKIEASYNNDYTFDQLIFPWIFGQEFDQYFMHMPVEVVESEYLGSSYVLAYRSQFNFSEINITGIANIESNQASLYPQPADDYVIFDWRSSNPVFDLDLYDVNGRLVMQKKIGNHKAVAIHHLTPGLYLYRLSDNQQHLISGKMSVR